MKSLSSAQSKARLRKHILFFMISVLLPALVLLFFTIRMNRQENELRKSRAEETRRQKALEIGRHLAERLDRTAEALRQIPASDREGLRSVYETFPHLVFAGDVEGGRLLMPWSDRIGEEAGSDEDASIRLVLQAQQAEFSRNDLSRAKSLLNKSLASAASPLRKSVVQLDLARVLAKSGDEDAALRLYREVLDYPNGVRDEYGIPEVLFAAERLSFMTNDVEPLFNRIEMLLAKNRWLPAEALYLIGDIARQLEENPAASPSQTRIEKLVQTLEDRHRGLDMLRSLEAYVAGRELIHPNLQPSEGSRIWEPFGRIPWIVGIERRLEDEGGILLAFNCPDVLSDVIENAGLSGTFPGSCRIASAEEREGIPLEKPFQNLYIRFEAADTASWMESSLPFPAFYWSILILVVGFTAFGGYLVWRDVTRELAIAEMRSNFAATVSHELKTPLTAIRMFAEALAMGVHKKPEAQQEYLQTIISESERLSRLLNNVLDFSKIEQGTRNYRFEPTSLIDVIRAAQKAMVFSLEQKGFNLAVDVEECLPLIQADRDALEQAVLNLLHNAMKYSGESRDIRLKVYRQDGTARMDVVDFGIGISEEDTSRIFGKYFRVPGLENQRIPGAGLGLTIVSHIARAHGGRVEVSSRSGEGSTFSMIIPLEAR